MPAKLKVLFRHKVALDKNLCQINTCKFSLNCKKKKIEKKKESDEASMFLL